jgi:hypothetical protein
MNRTNWSIAASVFFLALICARPAGAQPGERRFEAGGHLATSVSTEFDESDLGVGARLSWHPTTPLSVEGELTLYPGDLGERTAFSGGRVEGMFGATVGPRLGRLRPFAKVRPGFVTFQEAPEPIACILIFPPPLSCQLAAGQTLFALDVGGGVEWFPSNATFIRLDAGDRAVRYGSPVTDSDGNVRDGSFFGHDFRFTVGGGLRF